ncbi:MAG: GFA family protein [Polyangiaceae bacterium]
MIKGSCLCGGVKYEAEGPVGAMARCHCVQCRKASGAEFATNGNVAAEHFRITAGEELLGRYESSPGKVRVFCGRCGSPLFKRDDGRPGILRLRLGCVDTDLEQTPLVHLFVREKPNWSEICDGLPQYDTRP